MRKNDFNDLFDKDTDGFDSVNSEDNGEETCDMFDAVMTVSLMSKPFGIVWSDEKIEYFLKKRGYTIIERKSDLNGEEYKYKVAIKSDASVLPDTPNLRSTFDNELQDICINWLLKNAD